MNKYSLLTAATLIFTTATVQAGVIIGGTRIIYNGDKKERRLALKIRTNLLISFSHGVTPGKKAAINRRLWSRRRFFV